MAGPVLCTSSLCTCTVLPWCKFTASICRLASAAIWWSACHWFFELFVFTICTEFVEYHGQQHTLFFCDHSPISVSPPFWCAVDIKPGPGAYSPSVAATASRKAAFSIQARPHASKRGSSSPGPGQYGSASGKQHVGTSPNAPCYTFGLKTLGDKESERKPGPAGEWVSTLRMCACDFSAAHHVILACSPCAQQHQSLSTDCCPLLIELTFSDLCT